VVVSVLLAIDSALLSMSASETPAIGRMMSSATVCAPGTVLIGASFPAVISSVVVAVVTAVPSDTRQVRVRCGLALKSVGLSLVD